jgi:hypothetical protein
LTVLMDLPDHKDLPELTEQLDLPDHKEYREKLDRKA